MPECRYIGVPNMLRISHLLADTRKSLLFLCLTVGSVVALLPFSVYAATIKENSPFDLGTTDYAQATAPNATMVLIGTTTAATLGSLKVYNIKDVLSDDTQILGIVLENSATGIPYDCQSEDKTYAEWGITASPSAVTFPMTGTECGLVNGTISYVTVASASSTNGAGIRVTGNTNDQLAWQAFDDTSYEYAITENFIYIDDSDRNVAYNATFSGQLNNVDQTSATITYLVSFLSQSGIDYSDKTYTGYTTQTGAQSFTATTTFDQDDIVYVKAYLYDDDTPNAINLIDISNEVEFWVSANANPSQVVDLGTFRTKSTSTCAQNTGFSSSTSILSAAAFEHSLCVVGQILFVPSDFALEQVNKQVAVATGTAPFSYMYDIGNYVETIFTPTPASWSISVPTTTPIFSGFGGMVIVSSADLDSNAPFQMGRTAGGYLVILLIPLYVFGRLKIIGRSL